MADLTGSPTRQDVSVPSAKDTLSAWLYPSARSTPSTPGPALVMAHGLGGVKEMRLDAFATRFQALGYTVLVFDYACHGSSTGKPRGLIDWAQQQRDWRNAVTYTRGLEAVDAEQVGVFGTSFAGGHVIQVAAEDAKLKCAISQCPFTDGLKSSQTTGLSTLPKLTALGIKDLLMGSDEKPVLVPLVGDPGQVALMNAPDARAAEKALVPADCTTHLAEVPARLVLRMPLLRPGTYAAKVKCPIFFAVCGKDTVAPAAPTIAFAKKAPKGVVKVYDQVGHFDIYLGEPFEEAMKGYEEFLKKELPVAAA